MRAGGTIGKCSAVLQQVPTRMPRYPNRCRNGWESNKFHSPRIRSSRTRIDKTGRSERMHTLKTATARHWGIDRLACMAVGSRPRAAWAYAPKHIEGRMGASPVQLIVRESRQTRSRSMGRWRMRSPASEGRDSLLTPLQDDCGPPRQRMPASSFERLQGMLQLRATLLPLSRKLRQCMRTRAHCSAKKKCRIHADMNGIDSKEPAEASVLIRRNFSHIG